MNYYVWVNGYESMGIVNADTIQEAKEKVIISQGECKSIEIIDDSLFDEYGVAVLVS